MELVYNKSKPVAVTGMAFPTGDVNNYVVGSEEGTVYTASRHGRFVDTHTHTHTHTHTLLAQIIKNHIVKKEHCPTKRNQQNIQVVHMKKSL